MPQDSLVTPHPNYAPIRRNSATAGLPWFPLHPSEEPSSFYREHRSMSYSFSTQDAFVNPVVLDTIMQEEEDEVDMKERTRSKSTAAIMSNIWNPSFKQQDDNQKWVHPTTTSTHSRVVGSGRRLSLAPSMLNQMHVINDDLTERMRRFSLAPTHSLGLENSVLDPPRQPSTSSSVNQRRHSLAGPTISTANTNHQDFLVSELAVRERLESNKSFIENTIKTDDLGKGTRLDADIMQDAIFYVVEFKGGRSDVYYCHTTITTQTISNTDLVIVEADRGRDLGKVTMENISRQQLEQYYTQLKHHNHSEDQEEPIENKKYLPTEIYIKRIFRKARPDEITLLMAKGQDESKALMVCQSKIKQRKLNMQVVDAEYQWDRRKLTFYFVAEKRVDFRELVRELFKLYKTRIWMCAVSSIVHLK
ncbi:PSP1 C-terminal conserved region-domain-containing protein [Gilbertella persicaria]|uniref:PSP1 C-terminal conserved region-domain-containing protein n=1 Tax=Gilbertella persicaria TaxID=101096 RepID=UPI00221F29EA|nr:PSP1 C-terminal conserved region-domain-containing protein [Gilbertella persicaria]KAI8047837.1 PSP1 C-terminal conserved region-domain-containing protein [Gilbertella persicaria]